MPKMLRIAADDSPALSTLLNAKGIDAQPVERKSAADIQMLIVAIGGGTGMAAMLVGLGQALKQYFEGRAEVAKQRTVEITLPNKTIKVTGENIEAVLNELRPLLA